VLARSINTIWKWKCCAEAAAYAAACRNVGQTQANLLLSIVHANEKTAFGQEHGFTRIRSARDYQQRVPVSGWQDIEPYIARIATGEPNVATREPVLLMEPTSGTSSGEKLIPYTRSLRTQFQRGIAPWIHNLFTHHPAAARGRAYWSISPSLGPKRRTAGGIAIGFDDDTAYLGRIERFAMRHVLAVPNEVAQRHDIEIVRYATLLCLLAADDLALISVWSPVFLTSLLAPIREWSDRLIHDLRRGSESLRLRPNHRRADEVATLFRTTHHAAELYAALWPRLALISCWADAAAAHFVPQVQRLFPQVQLQPKGLLATEGFVSLPLAGTTGSALAVRSHFFEFVPIDRPTEVRLAQELQSGERYRVLLTTGGGLYRYDLGDEVEITGHVAECPTLRFVGRSSLTSDLVGEKLSESFVVAKVQQVLRQFALQPAFLLLLAELDPAPGYLLLTQGLTAEAGSRLAQRLEELLKENPYYAHAVAFRQLLPLRLAFLKQDAPAAALYEQACLRRGIKAGNIKPPLMATGEHWLDSFADAIMPGAILSPLGERSAATVV
jgi:hypothetical protein